MAEIGSFNGNLLWRNFESDFPSSDLKVSVIIWTNYSGLGRYIQIRYDKLFRCISPVLTRQDIEINAQTCRGI